MSRRRILTVAAIVFAFAGACVLGDWWWSYPVGTPLNFVGRQNCVDCHADQTRHWTGSDHDLAMDLATPQTVLGNFDEQRFEHFGQVSTMSRDGEQFFITTDNARGELEKFAVKYVFGVRPLQQYMVEFPDGRVQVLSIAWDVNSKRWFHLYPNEKIPHTDELHWTRPAQNWNFMCAECHSTNLQKNYDLASNTFKTTFSEIDVSCEACHGPGSLHIDLANSKSLFWDRNHGYGLATLKGKDPKHEIETCAKCHARRRIVHPDFSPGRELLDYYEPELLDGNLYHVDGQILEEDYEYGSFLQSRMHREGVRCTDCHDPHSTRLKLPGNQLCLRCHTLTKGNYDSPAHHHHKPDTQAAQCVECHMPTKHYMVVDPRRDHSIRIPRPDLSVKLGTPNACQACHKADPKSPSHGGEKRVALSDEQLRDKIIEWYGFKRRGDPHYAEAIAAGRELRPEGEEMLRKLVNNRSADRAKAVGPYVRASALSLLGNYPSDEARQDLIRGLADGEPLVRTAAVRRMELGREFSPSDASRLINQLTPLLDDPVRSVRTEASRVLARVPQTMFSTEYRKKFDQVLAEWQTGQMASADRAEAHMSLGIVAENQEQIDQAVKEYQTAIKLDATFVAARVNLAMLEHRRGRAAEAERLYREVIALRPDWDQGHYSLGLLLAETRLADAIAPLRKAAELRPMNARMRYNLGLALQQLGKAAEAELELAKCCQLDPLMIDARLALTLLYVEQKRWREAEASALRLIEFDRSPERVRLLEGIRRELKRPPTVGPTLP